MCLSTHSPRVPAREDALRQRPTSRPPVPQHSPAVLQRSGQPAPNLSAAAPPAQPSRPSARWPATQPLAAAPPHSPAVLRHGGQPAAGPGPQDPGYLPKRPQLWCGADTYKSDIFGEPWSPPGGRAGAEVRGRIRGRRHLHRAFLPLCGHSIAPAQGMRWRVSEILESLGPYVGVTLQSLEIGRETAATKAQDTDESTVLFGLSSMMQTLLTR
jgi:hypothetical protein